MARILEDRIPRVLKLNNPQLLDIPIEEIQESLAANLSWIDHVFGRSQRLIRTHKGIEQKYPAIPYRRQRKEYISVMPDQELGNFCFFVIDDTEDVGYIERQPVEIGADYAIIFWVDLSKIISPDDDLSVEPLKAQVLDVLSTKTFLKTGSITVNKVYNESKNVYKDYNLSEIDSQYKMSPFAAFRIEGTISLTQNCPL